MKVPTLARRLTWFEQGILLTAGQATTIIVLWVASAAEGEALALPAAWVPWVAQGLGVLHTLGALLGQRTPNTARLIVSLCWIAAASLAAPGMLDSPLGMLTILLLVGMFLVWLWHATEPIPTRSRAVRSRRYEDLVRGAALALSMVWFGSIIGGLAESPHALFALSLAGAMGIVTLAWVVRHGRLGERAVLLALLAAGLGLLAWLLDWPRLAATLLVLPVMPAALVLQRRRKELDPERHAPVWVELLGDPSVTLVVTFLLIATVGGLLLSSPLCSATGFGVGLLDAMFTAFSATCVTGLITLDTPNDFSPLGQGVILGLIQLGGLGIMTFSTAGFLLLGRRMSLRHEATVAELLGTEDRRLIASALRRILVVTAVTEAVGALVLTGLFVSGGDGLAQGLWRGVFTSISAFCNAGFALQSASLVPYATEPLVLHAIAVLIIVGGLGPVAVAAFPAAVRGRLHAVDLRLVYVTTGVLLVVPFLIFLGLELSNTLEGMSAVDQVTNAWFQSVTLRTAGFNSVDLAAVRPATLFLMISIMFVGGSPGSTAGGVKTTTIALLVLVLRAAVRGETHVRVFGFRVRQAVIYRAMAIVGLGGFSVVLWVLMLEMTHAMALDVALFEVVSALATVGLSVGGTALLDSVGKVLIIAAMFAGRVGPLTLVIFLARRSSTRAEVVLPEQDIAVG